MTILNDALKRQVEEVIIGVGSDLKELEEMKGSEDEEATRMVWVRRSCKE